MFNKLKSRETLVNSTDNLTFNKIEILNKNMLYVTHQVDKILEILNKNVVDLKLQQTVDKYFDDNEQDIPEEKT